MTQTKRIWLIRHAESVSNVGMSTSDPATISLSPKGFEQANSIVQKFTGCPELIVTSPHIRAKQTAEPLIKNYPNVLHEEWGVQEFTYLSPAKCQNMTRDERLPMVKRYWELSNPLYCDGPGAESFSEFIK